ncbi:hypothetical protein [uncultured Methanoculleus sp.]|uniref:hypothetical protein n=1 Tax=uncultured Methanoculleus sp. TaxID=183762 RepID=UPI003204DE1A
MPGPPVPAEVLLEGFIIGSGFDRRIIGVVTGPGVDGAKVPAGPSGAEGAVLSGVPAWMSRVPFRASFQTIPSGSPATGDRRRPSVASGI